MSSKQPYTPIRMPKKYFSMFILDMILYVMLLLLMGSSIPVFGVVLLTLALLIPPIAVIIAYVNYRVTFNQNQIIYRSFIGRTKTYRYEDVQTVAEGTPLINLIFANNKVVRVFKEDPQTKKLLRIIANRSNATFIKETH